jgi:hypothetical protein
MSHPDIQAALAKERRDTMLAQAAAARLARQVRETRRHRRASVPGSPEVRRPVTAAGRLRNVCASLARRGSSTLQYEPWSPSPEVHGASGPPEPALVAAHEEGSRA